MKRRYWMLVMRFPWRVLRLAEMSPGSRIFVAGLTTQFCVLDTALNGALAGFDSLTLLDLSRRVADIPNDEGGWKVKFSMKDTMITPILDVNKAGKGKTTKLMSVGNLEYTQKKSKTQKEQ